MKILWVGDGITPTGFATVSHGVLRPLHDAGHEVVHLAINYHGDPQDVAPWRVYPAAQFGHDSALGVDRLATIYAKEKPDVVCLLGDSWVLPLYLDALPEGARIVGYIPVDAENQWAAKKLNRLHAGIAYTRYGARELRKGGFKNPLHIAPHGIDLKTWYPVDKVLARKELRIDEATGIVADDLFIVSAINRNQLRKRLDLTFYVFAAFWASIGRPAEVRLNVHCAMIDLGWELLDLSTYLGIADQLIFSGTRDLREGKQSDARRMRLLHSMADVHLSTSMGEGWGLTAMEAMACGTVCLLPENGAFPDWVEGAEFVSCPTPFVHTNGVNTIGHVIDVDEAAERLKMLYLSRTARELGASIAHEHLKKPEFRWPAVAKIFERVFEEVRS